MRAVLLALGALAAAAFLAVGAALAVDAVGALSETRIGATRTPIPGAREVPLESGRHTVFYEVDDASVGGDGPADGESIHVPSLEIAIRSARDGRALELGNYSGSLEVSGGGRAASAVRTVRVPEDGRYRISVTSAADAASPAVVLGRPVTGRIVRLLIALAATVAGLGLAALVLASGIAMRARERHGSLRRES